MHDTLNDNRIEGSICKTMVMKKWIASKHYAVVYDIDSCC